MTSEAGAKKYRIHVLEGQNYKRMKAYRIDFEGQRLVVISGANGAGKSCVLDSVVEVFDGGRHGATMPLRRGEKKGFCKMDLGEFTATRRFTENGSTLTVEDKNGMAPKRVQEWLDKLAGPLNFDPMAFVEMEAKKQLELLKEMVRLDVDVDALKVESEAAYKRRTDVNRDAKQLEAQAAGITFPEDTPTEPVDIKALATSLQNANDDNAFLEKRKGNRETAEREAASMAIQAEKLRSELAAIVMRMTKQAEELEEGVKERLERLRTAEPLPEPVDIGPLREQLNKAQGVNDAVNLKRRKEALGMQLLAKQQEAAALTEKIEGNAKTVEEAVKAAKMPVEGLSFGANEVLYEGLPLQQINTAKQIQIAVGMAISGNPALRVVLIKNGNALGTAALKALAEMAEREDFQVLMEVMDESGKVGIVIEDGEVAVRSAEAG